VYNVTIEGRKVKREMIEHRGAAAMLGFDEKGKVILVKQHRYPHGYVLEIPAGTLEKGEKPLTCAHREMIEETGYQAKKMTHLLSYYPSIGYNTEIIHCYVASGLKKVADLNPDNDEFISVVKMDLKRLIGMIKKGKISDSKTICAVLTYAAKKNL
jgi:ADP-ribose pyrophosphatase